MHKNYVFWIAYRIYFYNFFKSLVKEQFKLKSVWGIYGSWPLWIGLIQCIADGFRSLYSNDNIKKYNGTDPFFKELPQKVQNILQHDFADLLSADLSVLVTLDPFKYNIHRLSATVSDTDTVQRLHYSPDKRGGGARQPRGVGQPEVKYSPEVPDSPLDILSDTLIKLPLSDILIESPLPDNSEQLPQSYDLGSPYNEVGQNVHDNAKTMSGEPGSPMQDTLHYEDDSPSPQTTKITINNNNDNKSHTLDLDSNSDNSDNDDTKSNKQKKQVMFKYND